MPETENYQCKKCGKIHPAQPKKCNCNCKKFRIIYHDEPLLIADACDYCNQDGDIKRYEQDLNLCDECAELLGMKREE